MGARQVGKTTLARKVFGSGLRYLDLEDPRTAQRFRDDARLALDALPDGAILDEAQAVPELFTALRGAINAERRRAGRYIVLGSAQPTLIRGISESLDVSYHTVKRQVEVLESVLLVRRLPPHFRNVGKRPTKAPKLFLRDTGLLHHLLNMGSAEELDAHPVRGASWEGFVVEDILRRERVAHPASQGCFWRTLAGAEIDLLLDRGGARVAVEIKAGRGDAPRAVRSLREALADVQAQRAWIVDQAPGAELLAPGSARIGFAEAGAGTP